MGRDAPIRYDASAVTTAISIRSQRSQELVGIGNASITRDSRS
jgi:hypothetical protein